MKTKVKFLVHREPKYFDHPAEEVFALFPEIYDNELVYEKTMLTCYAHVGQHSSCHIDFVDESREATLKEYLTLKEELISLGYKLDILNKAL